MVQARIMTWLAPLVAMLFYGGWAGYSNSMFGMKTALIAFGVQGGFALVSTWLLTHFIHYLIARQAPVPSLPGIFLQCAAMLFLIPASAHWVLGTPHILMAMAPGLVIGNIYSFMLIRWLLTEHPDGDEVGT